MARKTRTSTSRRAKKPVPTVDLGTIKWADLFSDIAIEQKGRDPIYLSKVARRQEHYEQEMERTNKLLALLEESTGGLWRMQDGTLIQIRQMSDSHLHNAIRHMEAKGAAADSVAKMKAEQERRKVDRQWAARTTDPRFADGRTFAGPPEKTDTVSGRQLAQVQERIEKLERQARARIADTAFDVRLQVTTALTTIRRLVGIENIDVVRSLEKLLDRVLP